MASQSYQIMLLWKRIWQSFTHSLLIDRHSIYLVKWNAHFLLPKLFFNNDFRYLVKYGNLIKYLILIFFFQHEKNPQSQKKVTVNFSKLILVWTFDWLVFINLDCVLRCRKMSYPRFELHAIRSKSFWISLTKIMKMGSSWFIDILKYPLIVTLYTNFRCIYMYIPFENICSLYYITICSLQSIIN